jgi:hypothetical protein
VSFWKSTCGDTAPLLWYWQRLPNASVSTVGPVTVTPSAELTSDAGGQSSLIVFPLTVVVDPPEVVVVVPPPVVVVDVVVVFVEVHALADATTSVIRTAPTMRNDVRAEDMVPPLLPSTVAPRPPPA